jgi:hypothetical protein
MKTRDSAPSSYAVYVIKKAVESLEPQATPGYTPRCSIGVQDDSQARRRAAEQTTREEGHGMNPANKSVAAFATTIRGAVAKVPAEEDVRLSVGRSLVVVVVV